MPFFLYFYAFSYKMKRSKIERGKNVKTDKILCIYLCTFAATVLGNTGTVLAIEIESSSQTLTTETMNETSASNTSTTDSTSTVSSDAEGASNTSSSEKSSQESTKEETQASDESQQETQEEPEKFMMFKVDLIRRAEIVPI